MANNQKRFIVMSGVLPSELELYLNEYTENMQDYTLKAVVCIDKMMLPVEVPDPKIVALYDKSVGKMETFCYPVFELKG